MITLNHVFAVVTELIDTLNNVDMMNEDFHIKIYNQKQIHAAYRILDNFRDEIIRENIKNKQKAKK